MLECVKSHGALQDDVSGQVKFWLRTDCRVKAIHEDGTMADVVKRSCTRENSGYSHSLLGAPAKVGLGGFQNTCNIVDFELRDSVLSTDAIHTYHCQEHADLILEDLETLGSHMSHLDKKLE